MASGIFVMPVLKTAAWRFVRGKGELANNIGAGVSILMNNLNQPAVPEAVLSMKHVGFIQRLMR